jgi:hypothetical protein
MVRPIEEVLRVVRRVIPPPPRFDLECLGIGPRVWDSFGGICLLHGAEHIPRGERGSDRRQDRRHLSVINYRQNKLGQGPRTPGKSTQGAGHTGVGSSLL